MIRDKLVEREWHDIEEGKEVVGTITFVYSHHKLELVNALLDVQHHYESQVLASQHIHLDHDNCLEIVVVKGKMPDISNLASKLKAIKGVKHASLTKSTLGRNI